MAAPGGTRARDGEAHRQLIVRCEPIQSLAVCPQNCGLLSSQLTITVSASVHLIDRHVLGAGVTSLTAPAGVDGCAPPTDVGAVRNTGTETFAAAKRETIAMADQPPADLRPAAAATKAAKKTQALLREARSLLRRADKVVAAAGAIDDPATHKLAAEASHAVERLTEHLVRLERQRHRHAREGPRPREHQ
jgi:hypothetical protein